MLIFSIFIFISSVPLHKSLVYFWDGIFSAGTLNFNNCYILTHPKGHGREHGQGHGQGQEHVKDMVQIEMMQGAQVAYQTFFDEFSDLFQAIFFT